MNIMDIVSKIWAALEEASVNIGVIPPDDLKFTFENSSDDKITLTRRLTEKKLIYNFAQTVKHEQSEFIKKIHDAKKVVVDNIASCIKMDRMFGTLDTETEVDIEPCLKANDGSIKKKCPILTCNVSAFRLKKHLDGTHSLLGEEATKYAVKMSSQMSINAMPTDSVCEQKTRSPVHLKRLKKKNNATALVSRKGNFRRCLLCNSLQLNMSNHLKRVHKLNKEHNEYQRYLLEPEVIPRCFTKIKNNKTVMLSDDELTEVRNKHEDDIKIQSENLNKRKNLRLDIVNLINDLNEEENEEKQRSITDKLEMTRKEYSEERYKDFRIYSENILRWKTAFLGDLQKKGYKNYKRLCTMAMDVILPYQQENTDIPLNFDQLMNGNVLTNVLDVFVEKSTISTTSKLKYLYFFGKLIDFLLSSSASPERREKESAEDIILRESRRKDSQYQIDSACCSLKKQKGGDIVKKKLKAEGNLMSDSDMTEIKRNAQEMISKVVEDNKSGQIVKYNKSEALKVRDCLLAIAVITLARRSLEIMHMTVNEALSANEKIVEDIPFFIIKIAIHKNSRMIEPADVAYNSHDYDVLKIYIEKLRAKINPSTNSNAVFIPQESFISNKQTLSFASITKILQKFTSKSGKSLSTRTVRQSKVTNHRAPKQNNTTKTVSREHLAKSMGHKPDTADVNYNFASVTDSVLKVLETSDEVLRAGPSCSSTPMKENDGSTTDNYSAKETDGNLSDGSLNNTIKQTRSRKIRKCISAIKEKEKLKAALSVELKNILNKRNIQTFKTKKGMFKVTAIKDMIDHKFSKRLSAKDIRQVAEELFDN